MKSNSSATVGRISGRAATSGRRRSFERTGTTAARSQRRVSVIGGLYRPPPALVALDNSPRPGVYLCVI
jgi:hypothetical protein